MSVGLTFKLDADGSASFTFPDRCAGCGAAKETTSGLTVARLVLTKDDEQEERRFSAQVPHCGRCAGTTKSVFLAGLVPFALGLLIVGGAAFAVVTFQAWRFGLDEVGKPHNANSLVLGAAAGLFGGIAGGFVFELVGRALLLPFLGRALWRAPLLVPSLFSDSDWVAGVEARVDRDFGRVRLTFPDEAYGQAFRAANASRLAAD